MSITIFDIPISIIVIEHGEEIKAFVLYVESGAPHSNDIWTCAHEQTGIVRHYTTKQIRYPSNQTFNINLNEKKVGKTVKKNRKSNNHRKIGRRN